jgi:hypothetical protein
MLIEHIFGSIGSPVRVHGKEHVFRCPFCEDRVGSTDKSGHLYVNEDAGFFCHRCECKGSFDWLLRLLKIDKSEIKIAAPELSSHWQAEFRLRSIGNKKAISAASVRLPPNVEDAWEVPEVYNYAMKRKLSLFDCTRYRLKSWLDDFNNYRLLFPDYSDDGILVYWTARAINSGVNPKYVAAADSEKSNCVWNLQNVDSSRPIYVAEGILSAIACGRNGVAVYGRNVSDSQAAMIIKKSGPSGVRIVFDADARRNSLVAAEKFIRGNIPCGVVFLPTAGSDPDSTDPAELRDLLLSSSPVSLEFLNILRLDSPIRKKMWIGGSYR